MDTFLELLLVITGLRLILDSFLIGVPALVALAFGGVLVGVIGRRDFRHPLALPHRR